LTTLDTTTAAQLSKAAYPGEPPPAGWTVFDTKSTGDNSVTAFFNANTNQVVMAFKGSNNVSNFQSDLFNSGAAAWQEISPLASQLLDAVRTQFPRYQIVTDGHSLGGGMAQTFALENQLSGYGQNSLPISQGAIQKDIVDQGGTYSASLAAWKEGNNTFNETNVSGDPATLYYSSLQGQIYLSTTTTTLASPYAIKELLGAALTFTPLAGPGAIITGNAAASAHSIDTVISLSQSQTGQGASTAGNAFLTFNDGVLTASEKSGDLSDNISLSLNDLAYNWSNTDNTFSVQYGTNLTTADTTVQWQQNGMTYTGGDLGAFLANVDAQMMLAAYNTEAQNGSIKVAAAMDVTADGVSSAIDNASTNNFLAERLSLGSISDQWVPLALGGEIPDGLLLAWSQAGAIQQLLAGIAQQYWQILRYSDSSIFTVHVIGYGNTFSPLVLDLSGKGINLVAPWQSNADFDLNADGQREASGWVGADNGILVLDKNGNGKIDSASEWFGESFSADGAPPPAGQGGFAALATLTTSGATTFSHDTARVDPVSGKSYFDLVQVWVDANQDGVTDMGELHTLSELGIASIDLQFTPNGRQVAGNEIVATAGYTKADGSRGDIADVGLAALGPTAPTGTWIPSTAAMVFAEYVSKGYAAMGKGQAQGVLNALPGGYIDISGYVSGVQSHMVDRLLTWEGYQQGLTHIPDATLITTYQGDNYSGLGQRQNTAAVDVVALLQAGVAFETTASNTASTVVAGADAIISAQTAAEIANATGTAAARAQANSTAANAATAWGNAVASYLQANAISAQLNARMETLRQELNDLVPVNDSYTQSLPGGYSYFSPIDARLAAAAFTAYSGALQLFNNMKIGMDSILAALAQSAGYTKAYVGQAGTTVTVNNEFNLILAGAGAETFVLGSNIDHILLSTAAGAVTLQGFQTGVSGDQLQFLGVGDSVKVENIAGGIQLVSADGQHYVNLLGANADNFNLYTNLTGVSSISFADFTQAGTRSIEGQRLYDGQVHITQITASNFGDTLIGDSEATTLIGGSGNDTFVVEGMGYHIDGGFGKDSVSYAKLGGGVAVDLKAGTDSLGSTIFQVEQVTGSAYRDYITGDTQDNVFDGSGGNDTLTGGGGNDAYLFGRGDGADTVINGIAANSSASSVLQLKAGIGADDLWLSRQGNDLVIQILGTFDRVTVSNWFANAYSELGAIELDNGLALDVASINNLVDVLAAYQQANPAFDPQHASAMPSGISLASSFSDHVQVPLVGRASNVALDVQQEYQSGRAVAGATAANAAASQNAADISAIAGSNATARAWRGVAAPINVPAGYRIYSYQDGVHFMPDGTLQNGIWVTDRNFDLDSTFGGKPSLVTSYRLLPNGLESDRLYFTVGTTTSSTDAVGSSYAAGSIVEGLAGHMDIILANVDAVAADLSVLSPTASSVGAAASARQQALGAAMQANAAPTASAQALARSTAANFEQQFDAAIAQFQGAANHMQSAANEVNVSSANLSVLIPASVTTVQQVWVAEWHSFSTVIPAHWNTVTTVTSYNFFTATDAAKYSTLQSAVGAAQTAYNDAAAEMSTLLNTFASMGNWTTVQFAGAGATVTADAGGDLLIAANGGNHTLLGGGGRDTFAFINANGAELDTVTNFEAGANGDRLLLIPAGARTAYFSENAAGAVTISYTLNNGARSTVQVTGVNYKQLSLYDNLQGIDTADFSTMSHGAVVALNSITPRDFDGYTHVSNLVGSAFADTLSGDVQDNTITGGKGNDTLMGGAGNDTYVWRKGDGNDLILDENQGVTANSQDILVLADAGAQDVKFTHSGSDLLVTVLSTNETITIQNQYSNPDDKVESIRFADGSQIALPSVDALPAGVVTLSLADQPVTAATMLIAGQTLSASNNLSDLDGLGAITYQWYASGVLIAGATASMLQLSAAQMGKSISVTASYTDGYGTAEAVSSAVTGIVIPNTAPVGSVTIAGTAVQGQTLTAANTLTDADGLGAITYQWFENGTAIAGATAGTLTLAQEQVGKNISVQASYTDGYGTLESVASTATAAVANINDTPTGSLDITGTALQGQVLTAVSNFVDQDGVGAMTYQWYADGVTITGATAAKFTLGLEQVGKHMSVTAGYTDNFGTVESIASVATGTVAHLNAAPTGAVTISGAVKQGEVLSVSNTLADADGLGAIGYQWYADGVAITGATGNSLTLAQAQVGKAITVEAKYTDGFATVETVASAATGAVQNVDDPRSGSLTVTGNVVQGNTLVAANDFADADGLGAIAYQWYADGVAIAGATADTFTLTQEQVGKNISVQAGYVDGFGMHESASVVVAEAVANVNDAPTGVVTITGTLAQGQTLTATNNLADLDGMGAVTYQWYADGVLIAGANAATLTLSPENVGQAISVAASYTDGFGTSESLTSAPTDAISAVSYFMGTAGNDTISGTTGADVMEGLAGDDIYYVNDAGDIVVEQLNGGNDTVNVSANYTVADNVEFVHITKAGIAVNGNTANNTFYIDAVGGNVLDGGGGINVASYLNATTAVRATLSSVGAGEASDGSDSLYNFADLIGGRYDDILTGNDANNVISGGTGNDVIRGGKGNDVLVSAGAGNDTYIFARGDGADAITDFDPTVGNHDIVSFESGITFDQLFFQQSGTTLIVRIIGTNDMISFNNWFSNTFSRIEEFRTADGHVLLGANVQAMVTAMASISLPPPGQFYLAANYAAQLAPSYAANWHVNSAPVGAVTISGTPAVGQTLLFTTSLTDADGMGAIHYQWYANDMEIVGANASSFTITQDTVGKQITARANYIDGYGTAESVRSDNAILISPPVMGTIDDDTIIGTVGADFMQGLAGNDIYVVNNVNDTIAENINGGADAVQASVSHTLEENVENLVLEGTQDIDGNGNDLNNVLIGNSGANTLAGGTGNDTLSGGLGNDTYKFGKGDGVDLVLESDATAGNIDTLLLGPGVAQQNLWMSRVGTDLRIAIMGTSDQIIVSNWYGGSQYQVEQIKTAEGRTMLNSDVDRFVQAMASFGVPPSSATSWPTTASPTGQVLIAVSH
jgi:Ca2+-binding RTX toxin-like protein